MRQLRLVLISYLLSGLVAFGLSLLLTRPIHAANPPVDTPCRGCHDETAREHTFPSGESVHLRIDLNLIDASAHSSGANEPVPCTGCHVNETRYRYPHRSELVQSRDEFVAMIEQSCQDCHYPHKPFHELEAAPAITDSRAITLAITASETAQIIYPPEYPTCADCHGSHNIDKAGSITMTAGAPTSAITDAITGTASSTTTSTKVSTMAGNCLTCHTDQTVAWTAEYIAPRAGLGTGTAGYIGSTRCASCHEEKYFSWQQTLHSRMIQDPSKNPGALVADFTQEDSVRTFSQQDVLYTIGSAWKQLYLSQTAESKLFILPAQWNVESKEWVAYQPEPGEGTDWLEDCGSCHVTGLDTQTWGFSEFSVGCESCHGPGESHAKDPKQVKLFDKADDQVCGSCHSRGTSLEGFYFPASYRPGDVLTEHFTLDTSAAIRWPDGSAKLHNQQYTDWHNDNRMQKSGEVTCTTCHSAHDEGVTARQLVKPLNDLCLQCHDQQKALVQHIPFHEQAIVNERHSFTCADCHMPKLASSATGTELGMDIRLHSFTQPNPQSTIDHGGLAAMPNACNRCHTDLGEDPEWAAQTIAYAKELKSAKPVSFFGPGPTPTSPPPPTPISAVGQPVIEAPLGISQWLRPALIMAFWLIVVLIVLWILNFIRTRRMKNA